MHLDREKICQLPTSKIGEIQPLVLKNCNPQKKKRNHESETWWLEDYLLRMAYSIRGPSHGVHWPTGHTIDRQETRRQSKTNHLSWRWHGLCFFSKPSHQEKFPASRNMSWYREHIWCFTSFLELVPFYHGISWYHDPKKHNRTLLVGGWTIHLNHVRQIGKSPWGGVQVFNKPQTTT